MKYWQVNKQRKMIAKFRNKGSMVIYWQPPIQGFMKVNFDVVFSDGKTTTACILRNMHGEIKGVWINHFEPPNPYCAETEAVIQALRVTKELRLDKVMFEGNTLNVIMALKDLEQKPNLMEGETDAAKFLSLEY